MQALIDAHIHLDLYESGIRERIMEELPFCGVRGVVSVSMHLDSCRINQQLHRRFPDRVYPAYGFHPEQEIPPAGELDKLFQWIGDHLQEAAAIGEVGLPYYLREDMRLARKALDDGPYIELLERFLVLAESADKPVVLHAVYEDADMACELLERHRVKRAHFHWFKGSGETVRRMIRSGFYISVTPDVVYEQEIRDLVAGYPLELMMVETDGPWPFEGPFQGMITHPQMVRQVVETISRIKSLSFDETANAVYRNTVEFYRI